MRIGTIIHGALGDCYEQLCSIKIIRNNAKYKSSKWIGFFSDARQMHIMEHFDLSVLDEIHTARDIPSIKVDKFFQFQIKDVELQIQVLKNLPDHIRSKFDLKSNLKPWHFIRKHDFAKGALALELSEKGKKYLPLCLKENEITMEMFEQRLTVGYLWRHRSSGEAIKQYWQKQKKWILRTKNELFDELISRYNAHIIIAGMKKKQNSPASDAVLKEGGFLPGEYKHKYTEETFDLPKDRCTYLKGIGYAAELEIMSKCNFLLMMPSGFSEILWMKRKCPVILTDPPPNYLLKLWWNRMPLFDNHRFKYAMYNSFVEHSAKNVLNFLKKQKLLK